MNMNIFARVSSLAIFALSVETGAAASSSFLPDTFTSWFWQSCKHLSLPSKLGRVSLKFTLQHLLSITGSILMAAISGQHGTVQIQPQVLCTVRRPLAVIQA